MHAMVGFAVLDEVVRLHDGENIGLAKYFRWCKRRQFY